MSSNEKPNFTRRNLQENYEVEDGVRIDWDAVTVVDLDVGNHLPTKLAPICKAFNESECDQPERACLYRHICSACKVPGHSALECKAYSNRGSPERTRRNLLWRGDEETSFSPCSQLSLTAEPLPSAPPIHLLPSGLVKTVKQQPELFKIVTTLNVDLFEMLLSRHPNKRFVKSVLDGFRYGFWPFARIPYAFTVNEAYNPTKKPDFKKFLEEQRDKEVEAGRFSKPFGARLFPGMTCMPVHVVKGPKKLRVIYDHSAGNYSLNSLIPEEARAVKLDGIKHMGYILRRARTLAKSKDIILFKSDVSSAYRIMPMSPYWQALQAVKIDGKYHIDRCNAFGNAASQRIFCSFFSLVLWIAENVFDIHDMLSYIDDNFSWDYRIRKRWYGPYGKFLPDKQARLLLLWDLLGIPHDSKKQEFGPMLTIIGYEVDVRRMCVRIPQAALEEMLPTIEALCTPTSSKDPHDYSWKTAGSNARTIGTVHDIRRVAGKVNWAIEVNPLLKPGINGLHRLLGGKTDPREPCHLDKEAKQDILWLVSHLRNANGISFSTSVAWNAAEATQVVYTCTSRNGMGFWCPKSKLGYYALFTFDLLSDIDMIFHRLVTIICVIHWSQKRGHPTNGGKKRLLVCTDPGNDTAVTVFKTLHAPIGMNRLVRFAMDMLLVSGIDLHVEKTSETDVENGRIAEALAGREVVSRNYPEIRIKKYELPIEMAEVINGVQV